MKIKLDLTSRSAMHAAVDEAFDSGIPIDFIKPPGQNPQTGVAVEAYIEVDTNPDNPVIAVIAAKKEVEAAKAQAAAAEQARQEAEQAKANADAQAAKVAAAAHAVIESAGLDKSAIQRNYDDVLTIVPMNLSAADGVIAPADETVVKNLDTVYLAQEDSISASRVYTAVNRVQ